MRGSRASASTIGAEREPGEVQAARMPQRASSSANARRRTCKETQRMVRAVDHVVALHGFAGTGASWDAVAERLGPDWTVHAPDLPGHGSAAGAPVSLDACIATA